MKKNVFYLFALVCAMSLFASCGNDDDETKIDPFGNYSGNLSVVLKMGDNSQEPIKSKESVQLIKGGSDNTFSFVLKNFMLGKTGVGNINIENVELVSAGNNKFTFSKNIPDMEITAGDKAGVATWIGPGLGKIPVRLNGTIDGSQVKVNITIPDFTGMDIIVDFAGTK